MKQQYRKRKVPKLAKSSPLRHPHATAAGLEDAIAVLWDIIQEQQQTLNYVALRAQRSIEILKEVRAGPNAYDAEQPAQPRRAVIRER